MPHMIYREFKDSKKGKKVAKRVKEEGGERQMETTKIRSTSSWF